MLKTVSFALVCFSTIVLYGNEKDERCPDGKKHYRMAIRHIESGGIGYDNGYTTFETFFSPDPSEWSVTPFLDARGHIFDDGKWAANAGVGARTIWGSWVYGINGYYDYRHTSHFHFNQVGLGFEALGELFDVRLNGYLPFGKKVSIPLGASFGSFSGNTLLLRQKNDYAMKGADLEMGVHFGKSENFDFYAATGPYYFRGSVGPNVWGGKARISGTYKELFTVEISDSYDTTFRNRFQGQVGFSFSFGAKSKVKREGKSCQFAGTLNDRMLQSVSRQEIIVVDKKTTNAVAIDPATGLPYVFVFVSNTSSSNGTFESPYHSFAQAQAGSPPNGVIYVFPGDGTTTGMDSGITLQPNQKLFGSGANNLLPTTVGAITIPAQTSLFPTITNSNLDTEGNAVTLSTNNTVSGFIITSPLNDCIFGANTESLQVTSCIFEDATTFAIEATLTGNSVITITGNQFLTNTNGINLTLNGTSNLICSDNLFKDQTSVSNTPIEVSANSNVFAATIENNVFQDNTTGSIRFAFNTVVNAEINVLNNTITNNGTGSQSTLGSSFVIIPTGTTDNCSIVLSNNTFSDNTSNSLYLHTSGAFTTLNVSASGNTMSGNGGSALVLATPTDRLTLLATDNTITAINDNGISMIASTPAASASVIIDNNIITAIGNDSNAIAFSQPVTTLDVTITNNTIDDVEGSGILFYSTEFTTLTLDISNNTISNCQNGGSNAASGLDVEQYTDLAASITNNTLSSNTGTAFVIASSLTAPITCLTLSGNTSPDYTLTNPGDGTFRLSPCNVDSVNVGTINEGGAIDLVQSCSSLNPCSP